MGTLGNDDFALLILHYLYPMAQVIETDRESNPYGLPIRYSAALSRASAEGDGSGITNGFFVFSAIALQTLLLLSRGLHRAQTQMKPESASSIQGYAAQAAPNN